MFAANVIGWVCCPLHVWLPVLQVVLCHVALSFEWAVQLQAITVKEAYAQLEKPCCT